jgi:site-specific DNA-methyltransferase (adenine-specific)
MRVERIGDATLYLGDCMEVLPTLNRVDALITDPPYGIGADEAAAKNKGKWGWKYHGDSAWDRERPPREVFEAMLAKARVAIIWGGNYFTDYLPPSMHWLSWDKGQEGFSLADFELAWSSQHKAARRIHYPRALALQDGKEHPTQKPVAVMRWCIDQAGQAGSVLDPFMGSGTTGVACAQMGRKFIGIEREPKYFDIACRRIEEAYKQPALIPHEAPRAEQQGLEL